MTSKKKMQRLSDVGELGLLDWIRKNMPSNVSGLLRGIGDDAAVLRGGELITVDMLVENVHFQKKWHDPVRLGRKALAVNLSDIAAMGGEPRCAFLSLGVNGKTPLKEIEAFFNGFAGMAREHGMAVAGGDLTGSTGPMIISVAVLGRAERPVLRSGARPGDILLVTGTIGDAGLALRFMMKKSSSSGGKHVKTITERLLNPEPRIALGRRVAQYASAMIDLSDGLAADLNNLCRESNVGAKIWLNKLPLSTAYKFIKKKSERSAKSGYYHEALFGGEDYELLFAIPPSLRETFRQLSESLPLTEIGEVTAKEAGIVAETQKGTVPLPPTGDFAHFK